MTETKTQTLHYLEQTAYQRIKRMYHHEEAVPLIEHIRANIVASSLDFALAIVCQTHRDLTREDIGLRMGFDPEYDPWASTPAHFRWTIA